MQNMHYLGPEVNKRKTNYCVKDGSGTIPTEGAIPATRFDLDRWMRTLPQPWTAAMEATRPGTQEAHIEGLPARLSPITPGTRFLFSTGRSSRPYSLCPTDLLAAISCLFCIDSFLAWGVDGHSPPS